MMSGRTIGGIAGHGAIAYVCELKSAGHDQLRGGSVAATASRKATPRPVQPVLPTGERRRVGTDVFDEEQLSVGAQHTGDLSEGEIGSGDRAQHEA